MLPSEKIQAVLSGAASLDTLDPAERSNIRLAIYHKACEVLNAGNREQRRIALNKVPETIKEAVEAEAERIWKLRRANE